MANKPPQLDPRMVRRLVDQWLFESGRRVRHGRSILGMSAPALAEMTGLTPESISRIERGLQAPRDSARIAIAVALLTEVDVLWPPIPRYQAEMIGRRAA